jgi:DNA-binding transcriptional MerR regulator
MKLMDQGKAQNKNTSNTPPPTPDSYYKIGDVCSKTDTQPYVLRFWESEFPQLTPQKSRSGQRIYTDSDVLLVQKIKKLLYEEEYTIAGARKKLEDEGYVVAAEQSRNPAARRKSASSPAGPMNSAAVAEVRKELRALKKLLES